MRVFAYFLHVQKVGRPGGETPNPKCSGHSRQTKAEGFALGAAGITPAAPKASASARPQRAGPPGAPYDFHARAK